MSKRKEKWITHLGTIECTVTRIELPRVTKIFQWLLQLLYMWVKTNYTPPLPLPTTYSLSLVPHCRVTHEFLRARGEQEFKGEPKYAVHMCQEIKTAINLVSDLEWKWRVFSHRSQCKRTWSRVQNICASSCWKRLTRVRPERAPESSLRCSTPKSAILRGSSRQERGRWSNIRLNRALVMDQITPSNYNIPVSGAVHWL